MHGLIKIQQLNQLLQETNAKIISQLETIATLYERNRSSTAECLLRKSPSPEPVSAEGFAHYTDSREDCEAIVEVSADLNLAPPSGGNEEISKPNSACTLERKPASGTADSVSQLNVIAGGLIQTSLTLTVDQPNGSLENGSLLSRLAGSNYKQPQHSKNHRSSCSQRQRPIVVTAYKPKVKRNKSERKSYHAKTQSSSSSRCVSKFSYALKRKETKMSIKAFNSGWNEWSGTGTQVTNKKLGDLRFTRTYKFRRKHQRMPQWMTRRMITKAKSSGALTALRLASFISGGRC